MLKVETSLNKKDFTILVGLFTFVFVFPTQKRQHIFRAFKTVFNSTINEYRSITKNNFRPGIG